MLDVLDEGDGKILGLRLAGKATRSDVEDAIALLERRIAETGGPLRLLIELRDLGGIEPSALWPDLKFSLRHRHDFERAALVGDKTWLEWWGRLVGALSPAEVRHFHASDIDQAWHWLRER